MRHSFLSMLIITLLFSLHGTTISAQDEYDKQDDCTFALQMYDGDELLNQVLLDAVDSTGHPYAYILVNGRVWDTDFWGKDEHDGCLNDRGPCRCAYGQFPFTFFPATQIENDKMTSLDAYYGGSYRNGVFYSAEYNCAKGELRYFYFNRSKKNPFALYFFDGLLLNKHPSKRQIIYCRGWPFLYKKRNQLLS